MPHGLIKEFKSQLPKFVASKIGQLQAAAITYLNSKINEIYQELVTSCPPPEVLQQLAKTVTTLKKVIVKFDKQTASLNNIPKKLDPAIKVGKTIVEILAHMPIPTTIGLPPPYGGVLVSIPAGVIQSQSNLLVFARNMVDTLSNDQAAIKDMLGSTAGIFNPIKIKLTQIEALIQRCSENPNLTPEERKGIIDNTGGGLVRDRNRIGESYIGANGNAYVLTVIEDGNTKTVAPKRQAIAKDFRGIVVLKGPLSFAGDTQVLIDELKLRIDNQLP